MEAQAEAAPAAVTDTTAPVEKKPRKREVAAEKRSLYANLIKAMSEMSSALKNKTNPFAKSKYADITSVLEAIKPPLYKYGLGMRQEAVTRQDKQGILFVDVETIVFDEKAELSSGVLSIPIASGNVAQAIGSAISYARRYSAMSFFGIASDDDDGLSAGNHNAQQCDPQLVAQAQQAAAQGLQAYQQWFLSLSNDARTALTQSGVHAQIKASLGAA